MVSDHRSRMESGLGLAPLSSSTQEGGQSGSPISRREEFDTVPGGGNNRLSGGRAAVRLYARPKTPVPFQLYPHETASVDLDHAVDSEGRTFKTAPSLKRRRNSEQEFESLPPVSYKPPSTVRNLVWIGVISLISFAVIFFWQQSRAPLWEDPLTPLATASHDRTHSTAAASVLYRAAPAPSDEESSPAPVMRKPIAAPEKQAEPASPHSSEKSRSAPAKRPPVASPREAEQPRPPTSSGSDPWLP